jgi:Domain of unknown function (DUF4412)
MLLKYWTRGLVVAGCALVVALPAAAADLTIVYNVTGGRGGATTATTYLGSDQLRTSDGEQDTIYDLASGRLVFVDHRKKQYWETSSEEMNAAMARMSEQMGPAKGIMSKMMGGVADSVSVQKGSDTKTVAGYVCDHYTLSAGKSMKVEMWAARDLAPPARYYDARSALFVQNPLLGESFRKLYSEMSKIKGLPLEEHTSFSMMGHGTETTRQAVEVKKGPIPATAFEVPAGYKQVKSPFQK